MPPAATLQTYSVASKTVASNSSRNTRMPLNLNNLIVLSLAKLEIQEYEVFII
jgi:hypothetical protein